MSLYERIEQEGLTSEQVNHLFRKEMVRYRNMLAHQLAVIEKDGEDNVTARLSAMSAYFNSIPKAAGPLTANRRREAAALVAKMFR